MADRFKVEPDEQVLLKGSLTYRKSKWGFVDCQGVLTTRRLVLGKKLNMMWSIIPRLFVLIAGKRIVFEIPLGSFHSIRRDKEEMGAYFILRTIDGAEYPVNANSVFGNGNDDWIKAIADAVKSAGPGVSVREDPTSMEFVR